LVSFCGRGGSVGGFTSAGRLEQVEKKEERHREPGEEVISTSLIPLSIAAAAGFGWIYS